MSAGASSSNQPVLSLLISKQSAASAGNMKRLTCCAVEDFIYLIFCCNRPDTGCSQQKNYQSWLQLGALLFCAVSDRTIFIWKCHTLFRWKLPLKRDSLELLHSVKSCWSVLSSRNLQESYFYFLFCCHHCYHSCRYRMLRPHFHHFYPEKVYGAPFLCSVFPLLKLCLMFFSFPMTKLSCVLTLSGAIVFDLWDIATV